MQNSEDLKAISSKLDFAQLGKDYPLYTRKELFLIGLRDADVCIDYQALKGKGDYDALKTFVKSEGYSAHYNILGTARDAVKGQPKPKKGQDDEDIVLAFGKKLKHLPRLVAEAKNMPEHLLQGAAVMTRTKEIFVALGILP